MRGAKGTSLKSINPSGKNTLQYVENHIFCIRCHSSFTEKLVMSREQYRGRLFNGNRATTHENARKLRKPLTEAEALLWNRLRNRQLKGKKFRRQHPYANYVLDFYCHEAKLAVEIDGEVHNSHDAKEYDQARTNLLNLYNISVLRFWNKEVIDDVEKVLERISRYL